MACKYCKGKFKGEICSDWCIEEWKKDADKELNRYEQQ